MAKYLTQQKFDGIDIQHHQIRFGGTLDIDDDDLNEIRLDGLTVLMIAVRCDDASVKILSDSGDARLKYVLNAQVAVPLTGEMRERGLVFLRDRDGQLEMPVIESVGPAVPPEGGGYADPVPAPASTNQQGPAPIVTPPQPAAPVGVDSTTGEVVPEPTDEFEVGDSDPGAGPIDRESRPIERHGPVVDDSPPKPDAFTVAGFDPGDAPGPPAPAQTDAPVANEVETVGSVHRPDREGDEALEQFMTEEARA